MNLKLENKPVIMMAFSGIGLVVAIDMNLQDKKQLLFINDFFP